MARGVSTGIVWFRNDLRLDDNPAWAAATRRFDRVVAVFVVEPAAMAGCGPHRRAALAGSLCALDDDLAALGGRLTVLDGPAVGVIPALSVRFGGAPVVWNADVTPFARARDDSVGRRVDHEVHHGRFVHPVGSITTGTGGAYRVFAPFHRRWLDRPWERWPVSTDVEVASDPGLGAASLGPASPEFGRAAASARLDAFVDAVDAVDAYADDRDRVDRATTSRLSVDLHFGVLSPRRVVDAVSGRGEGGAAFVRQLAWREFCAQLLAANPGMTRGALRPEFDRVSWRSDPEALRSWTEGMTGYPIVDAAMRQLRAEGWIHNRLRMIAASFLVKDLLVDWRLGERHFRRLLVDGDVAQNVVNWQWVAGTGADAAPYFRVINPTLQARRFDPNGDYVRRWVPELSGLSGATIHAPWDVPPLELAAAGVTLGDDYPAPIVDHASARIEAISAYEGAFRSR